MILLITGASHTGKTALAQRMLEKYSYPCLSMDHLKMGLIRSGQTALTPEDDREMTAYLWPIVREMVKTVLENQQNLIVEGCYIPGGWRADFTGEQLKEISSRCLVFSEAYIRAHFEDIKLYANVVEKRLEDTDCTMETVLADNREMAEQCRKDGTPCIWIHEDYETELEAAIAAWNLEREAKKR